MRWRPVLIKLLSLFIEHRSSPQGADARLIAYCSDLAYLAVKNLTGPLEWDRLKVLLITFQVSPPLSKHFLCGPTRWILLEMFHLMHQVGSYFDWLTEQFRWESFKMDLQDFWFSSGPLLSFAHEEYSTEWVIFFLCTVFSADGQQSKQRATWATGKDEKNKSNVSWQQGFPARL